MADVQFLPDGMSANQPCIIVRVELGVLSLSTYFMALKGCACQLFCISFDLSARIDLEAAYYSY